MTLVVHAINEEQAIQISDRRLTSVNGIVTDEGNKAATFQCEDGRFAVGFAGLAYSGSFKTANWLLEALRKCAKPTFMAYETIQGFAEAATNEFSRNGFLRNLSKRDRRVTFLFSGFLRRDGAPRASYAMVTNFQDYSVGADSPIAWDRFHATFYGEGPTSRESFWSVQRIGMWPEFDGDDLVTLQWFAQQKKPADAIAHKAFKLIRSIAERPASAGLIGKQLMSVVVPADFNSPILFEYDSATPKHTYYIPNSLVMTKACPGVISRDFQLAPLDPTRTPPMVGPRQRPNEPCRCQSGKKYKRCHGERKH